MVRIDTTEIAREVYFEVSAACQQPFFAVTLHTLRNWPTVFIFYEIDTALIVSTNG